MKQSELEKLRRESLRKAAIVSYIQRRRRLDDGGSSTVDTAPYRFATNLNTFPQSFTALAGIRLRVTSRMFFVVAGDRKTLKLSFPSARIDPSGFVDNTNAYTIVKCAIEKDGGGYVPVLFSGAAGRAVAAGTTDIQSDAVLPASFSLSKFTSGDIYWVRLEVSVTTAGHQIPAGIPYFGAGGQTFPASVGWAWDSSENATVSDVYGTGNISLGTGVGTGVTAPIMPIVLGQHSTGDPATWVGIGDSIMAGSNDALAGQGFSGYFARCLTNAAFTGPWIGGLNMGCSGSRPQLWNSGVNPTRGTTYLQYAKYCVNNYGSNSVALGDSLATMQTESQTLWTTIRAAGVTEIVQVPIMPRTTTTDAYATEANQTYVAQFTAAGTAGSFNTWLTTQIGSTRISSVASTTPLLGVDPWKWVVTGAANYATTDGIHPGTQGHTLEAVPMRTAIAAYA